MDRGEAFRLPACYSTRCVSLGLGALELPPPPLCSLVLWGSCPSPSLPSLRPIPPLPSLFPIPPRTSRPLHSCSSAPRQLPPALPLSGLGSRHSRCSEERAARGSRQCGALRALCCSHRSLSAGRPDSTASDSMRL